MSLLAHSPRRSSRTGSICSIIICLSSRTFGITTVCNPSPVEADLPSSRVAIANSDVVIVNDVEAAAYGGPHALLQRGAGSVVVTHGRTGASRVDASGSARADGFDVDVVDSTGAGDAFCAAYAIRRDLAFACAAGALACRSLGARTGHANVDEVEHLLREQPRSPR